MNILNNKLRYLLKPTAIVTAVLYMLILNHNALAATSSATVTAEIVRTMTIDTQTGLGFGDISTSESAGEVTITPSGEVTFTGGVTASSAVLATPAAFEVKGEPNATYSVTLPNSLTLGDGSSNSMIVDSFTSSAGTSDVIDSDGSRTLTVGAKLKVNANQPLGTYSDQMSIAVDYN